MKSHGEKQDVVSVDEWMDEGEVVHICNGILFGHRREWVLAAAAWMDLEGVCRAG